nr:hypothetical protein [Candidatus Microthrix sp.]
MAKPSWKSSTSPRDNGTGTRGDAVNLDRAVLVGARGAGPSQPLGVGAPGQQRGQRADQSTGLVSQPVPSTPVTRRTGNRLANTRKLAVPALGPSPVSPLSGVISGDAMAPS